jgi:ABC-type transport system substrate-binding protein
MKKPKGELRIAFDGAWQSIHPGLQHTLIGDLTLSNQFEPLVGINANGAYVALAAKEWTISKDFKLLKFKIDTARRFADGSRLSAGDFKTSWETSLKLDPKSSNNSLLDVLYKVDGFSNFSKSGEISGLKVIDNETLEIHFATPFRMALEHLSGNRFAAYHERDGKFIGTGAYVINELSPKLLRLTPNPYFSDEPKPKADILLSVIDAESAVEDLRSGKIDAVGYATGAQISSDLASAQNLSTIVGEDAIHRAIYLNNQRGHFFEKREYRLALQYLVQEYLEQHSMLGNPLYTALDPQVYLPLQAGRISESDATSIIESGKAFVPDLLEAARANPPILIETDALSLRPLLKAIGVEISEKSRVVPRSEIIGIIYKGVEADLIPGSFGVASGDPDGIYHKLGKSGAIASPMTANVEVERVLEVGRSITDKDKLDSFYKSVNETILREAPFIHMGFNKAIAIYRNDKIEVSQAVLRRNEGHLNIFEAK